MAHEQLLRLFLAIDLPANVRQALGKLQSRLEPLYHAGTYPATENLHITLHFLGATAVSRLPELIRAFEAVEMPYLTLRLKQLGYFPTDHKARVAMVSLEGDTALLVDLYDRLAIELKSLGFRMDHRKYVPHVTIARFKFPPRGECIEDAFHTANPLLATVEPFVVKQFTLYESTLDPKGARYAPLGRFPRSG